MGEFAWLLKRATLVVEGVIASGDIEAIKELDDFLVAFANRQRDKLLAKMASNKN